MKLRYGALLSFFWLMAFPYSLIGARASSSQNLNKALFVAVWKEDAPAVRTLLARGADPNAQDQNGNTVLDRAVYAAYGSTDAIIRLLLDHGVKVNGKNRDGSTPLDTASGNVGIMRLLIDRGADVNIEDEEGTTPLMQAAHAGNLQGVALLLSHGADPRARDRNGATVLMYAAEWASGDFVVLEDNYVQAVPLLIRAGVDPNAQNDSGQTALMMAAWWHHPSLVKTLLDNGADVTVRDKRGRTALTWAARDGKEDEGVQALLKKGASIGLLEAILLQDRAIALSELVHPIDLNARGPYGETPLMAATEKGDADLVRALLDKGADPNAHEDEDSHSESFRKREKSLHPSPEPRPNLGQTALMLALAGRQEYHMSGMLFWSGHPNDPARLEIVNALLAAGANVNASDQYGVTALLRAAEISPPPVVETLLRHGADPNGKGEYRYEGRTTPLTIAVENSRVAVARILLAHGADVNGRASTLMTRDATPLMAAASYGSAEMVRMLLEHGANIHARDSNGKTALYWAQRAKRKDIVRLLKQAGAQE